jgi:hypothetical protein
MVGIKDNPCRMQEFRITRAQQLDTIYGENPQKACYLYSNIRVVCILLLQKPSNLKYRQHLLQLRAERAAVDTETSSLA